MLSFKDILRTILPVLLLVSMFGCGTSDSSDNDRFLQAELIQRGLESQVTNTLGNYDVPITEKQLSLENALKIDVSLKYRGAISPWRENGNPENDIIVFLISFDARMDGIPVNGNILSVSQVHEPSNLQPTGEDVENHEGTYYAFFVDGIGDRPEVPVQIALRGTDEILLITVDPAKHTLPGNFALYVDKSQVNVEDTGNKSMLLTKFTSTNNEVTDEDHFVTVIHFPNRKDVFGGTARPGWGYGVEYDNQSDFDYYVLSLK